MQLHACPQTPLEAFYMLPYQQVEAVRRFQPMKACGELLNFKLSLAVAVLQMGVLQAS
jgi:hypothetical protein